MNNMSFVDFTEENERLFYEMAFSFYEPEGILGKTNESILRKTFLNCISQSVFVRGIFICCDNIISGYALLTFTYSNEYGGLIMFIDELYIKPEYRKRGLASVFIMGIVAEYKYKVSHVELVVRKDNIAAVNLYKKHGFSFDEAIIMYKDLSEG